MYKRILLAIGIITALAVGCATLFRPMQQEKELMTFVALDNANGEYLPKNFRLLDKKLVQGVNASASGQFSAKELSALIKHIKTIHPSSPKIWIIDLRQESHGFVNGLPITWYQDRNAGNFGRSITEIFSAEKGLLATIPLGRAIDLYKIVKGRDGEVSPGQKYTVTVEKVQTEEELVLQYGLSYFRLFTLDHNKPENHDVDRFIEFVNTQAQPDDWLHFHCRGGRGRTSTYLTLLFIMFNAHHMGFEEILRHQQHIGSIDLSKRYSEENKLWKNDLANFRYEFIKDFYRFAKDPQGLGNKTWSEWLAQQSTNQAK